MELLPLENLRNVLRDLDIKGYIEFGAPEDEYDNLAVELHKILNSFPTIEVLSRHAVEQCIGLYWLGYWKDSHDNTYDLEEAIKETKELSRFTWATMLLSESTNVMAET